MPRRRHNIVNSKVIQRTTSETLRIGEVDGAGHRPSNLSNLQFQCQTNSKTPASASASFVVTSVSARADSIQCESPDDSEEISRQTDIETPSFSEDTSYSQYTEDVDYCDDIVLKRCVNVVTSHNIQATAEEAEESPGNYDEPLSEIQNTEIHNGRFIGRFQVVKVESINPFRRGRWVCHDYIDNSEYAPRDGYEFYGGKFVKRKELETIKKQCETFIFGQVASVHVATYADSMNPPVAFLEVDSECSSATVLLRASLGGIT